VIRPGGAVGRQFDGAVEVDDGLIEFARAIQHPAIKGLHCRRKRIAIFEALHVGNRFRETSERHAQHGGKEVRIHVVRVDLRAQGLAFTEMFVLVNNTQFQPPPPRTLTSATYADDFSAVEALGRRTGSTRTDDETALAPFWEGNASVHWNQAANQIAHANHMSLSRSSRLLTVLNIAMADTAFTIWSAKRFYGTMATEVTWRPVTAIPLADDDGNADTSADPAWLPLVNTPSHPEYPAGHPSLNDAAATVLLAHFGDAQTFTLTTAGQPSRTYTSISQARLDGNNARVWGGMHYPSTVAISDGVGAAIARYVNENAMQRRQQPAQR
jgi:hypothetical protein